MAYKDKSKQSVDGESIVANSQNAQFTENGGVQADNPYTEKYQNDGQGYRHEDQGSLYGNARRFTWTDQSGVFGSSFSLSSLGGGLLVVDREFRKSIETRIVKQGFRIELIPFDSVKYRELQLDVMCIAVVNDNDDGKGYIGFHPLIVTNSAVRLRTYTETSRVTNIDYTVERLPCQLFNDHLIDFLKREVSRYFNGRPVTCPAGAVLNTDLIDLQDEKLVDDIVLNSVAAIRSNVIAKHNGTHPNQIADINLAADLGVETLELRRETVGGVVYDEYHQPMRADMKVTLMARTNDQGRGGDDADYNTVNEIGMVTAYTDILPSIPNSSPLSSGLFSNRNRNYEDEEERHRQFAANIVITSITPVRDQSINNILTLLVTAVDAIGGNDYYWARILDPHNQPEHYPQSIAGLNYEIAIRNDLPDEDFVELPVHSEIFDRRKFEDFMNRYFNPNVSFSILVPMAGPGTWKYSILSAAATEPDAALLDKDSANATILRHAELMCNGNFSELYKKYGGAGRVVTMLPNRLVPLGTYVNEDKQVRSLQDIGRAFLLNQVNRKREMYSFVEEFTMAQTDPNMSAIVRLGIAIENMQRIAPSMRVYSYGAIYDFTAAFISALHEGAYSTGFRVETVDVEQRSVRGGYQNATYINDSLLSGFQTTLLRQSSGRRGNGSFMPSFRSYNY